MAIEVPAAVPPLQPRPVTTQPESADFDRRWASWQAKGTAHDRAVRQKIAVAAPILIIVAVVIIYTLLGR